MMWTLLRTVLRARRRGLLRLVPAEGPVRLDCLADRCAKCCRLLGSPIVTPEEAQRLRGEVLRRTDRAIFIQSHRGCCCLLRDGLCSVYEVRPQGCREYPWYNLDGVLYYDAGCPGMLRDRDGRPTADEIGPFERFFPGAHPVVIRLIRWLCTRRTGGDRHEARRQPDKA